MEIPLLVDAGAEVVDTESPHQDCVLVARSLNVSPKDVSWHERGPRGGSHSHYYRAEIETRDSAGDMVRLSLILTRDLQQVFGSVLPPVKATAEEVLRLLSHHNLRGIEPHGLVRMIEGSPGDRSARYWVRIAKGSAVDGLAGTHLVGEYLARTEGDAVDTMHYALASQSHREVVALAAEIRATLVHPDQPLVLDASSLPVDVFGRRMNRPSLTPGSGVALANTAQGKKLVAEEYGYLYLVPCQEDGIELLRMEIRSPIEIGTGKLHADFLCLPTQDRSNAPPSAMDVQSIVAAHGVCCGIDPAACNRVSEALSAPRAGARLETVARGRLPKHGRDGLITRADGDTAPAPASMVERVWPTGMSVNEGNVLAVLDAATAGEPGYTVTGDRLNATAGKPVSLAAGANVEVEVLHGTKSLFRSATEGFVVFWDHTVEVIQLK